MIGFGQRTDEESRTIYVLVAKEENSPTPVPDVLQPMLAEFSDINYARGTFNTKLT
jgi:hypothetical protein